MIAENKKKLSTRRTQQMSTKETTAKIIFIKGALKALNRVAKETEKQRKELTALLQQLEGQKESTN
jgi:hypothetical protein